MDSNAVSPVLLFETLNAYQRTEALRTAIELDLFSQVSAEGSSGKLLAERMKCSERGTRILCDYLTTVGFLQKMDGLYRLTPVSAAFLDSRSPKCMSSAVDFLLAPQLGASFHKLTDTVRNGATELSEHGTMDPDHPIWERFARSMASMAAMPAVLLAQRVKIPTDRPTRVLDVAAGHGLYGIEVARKFPQAQVSAVDWTSVLAVAEQNAAAKEVANRFHCIRGSVFDVDIGADYDAILLPNFIHHFDYRTCVVLLKKLHKAMRAGGGVYVLEFVPNDDRVTPPAAASFALTMLATTKGGDAYTRREIEKMLGEAGFKNCDAFGLPPSLHDVVVGYK